MARLTLSPLLSDIRKRTASTVFAKCLNAHYCKAHTKPRDPQSSAQLKVRSTFTRMRTLFKSLPSYVISQMSYTVERLSLTPFNWFCSRNQSYEQSYLTQVFSTRHPSMADITLHEIFQRGPTGVQINYTYHGDPTNVYLYGWNRTAVEFGRDDFFNLFQTGWFNVAAGYAYGPATPGELNVYVLLARNSVTARMTASVSTVWLQP